MLKCVGVRVEPLVRPNIAVAPLRQGDPRWDVIGAFTHVVNLPSIFPVNNPAFTTSHHGNVSRTTRQVFIGYRFV